MTWDMAMEQARAMATATRTRWRVFQVPDGTGFYGPRAVRWSIRGTGRPLWSGFCVHGGRSGECVEGAHDV